jgi:general secretion pathway protein D
MPHQIFVPIRAWLLLRVGLLGAILGAVGWASEIPELPAAVPCADGIPGAQACTASKKELKEAKAAFARGLKLEERKQMEEAFHSFERAAELVPQDVQYLTARELAREELVFDYVQQGNRNLLRGQQVEALAAFRSALQLDPKNEFAQQQLKDALGSSAPKAASAMEVVAEAGPPELAPEDQLADFHYRGDSQGLLTQIASVYGIKVTLDDSVPSRRVRFDITGVNFYAAMRAAAVVTKTFWSTLDEKQIFVAADTPENHRLFDRMGLRSFRVSAASTPQEINDVVNVLRSVFDIRFVTQQPQSGAVIVRAPQNVLDAATNLLEGMDGSRPEVMLDVQTYEVSHTFTRNMGLHIPNQFNLFNIPAGALAALGGQNIQSLINQLIAGGGINQANSTSISALLAQLQNQQNSIFSQPLATFGGGLTLMGLSLDQLSATLSLNESSVKSLEHATLRASQGKDVNFHLGTRYPILNASFAPIFNSPAIAQVIGNNTFTPAFPSFNYEDLGLSVKAKPAIHTTSDVSLQLEMQIRALGTQTLNGVPVISNREYKGSITLKDGEPAVIAGSLSRTEQRSLSGIPGMAQVPGLNKVTASNTASEDDDELLIVITPHVTSQANHGPDAEIWMLKGQ